MDNNNENMVLAARDVLGWAGLPGGLTPGGFTSRLIHAASTADSTNIERLRLGFPAMVTAVLLYKNDPDGIDKLRELARGSAN